MWTENVTRFSDEEGKKGPIQVGQLADLIVPDRDYFSCRRTRSPVSRRTSPSSRHERDRFPTSGRQVSFGATTLRDLDYLGVR
jgi:hypothetical protein